MDCKLIIVVLTGALLSVACAQTRQYYFVNTNLTWTSAQSVCRQDFTDLATIESLADVNAVLNTATNFTGKAWIGLHDDLENSWKWSLNVSSFYGEGETNFRNWQSGQPNNLGGKQYCVRLVADGKWDDYICSEGHRFVCYNGTVNGTPSYIFNSTLFLSWTEAQQFCRENYVDLVSIRNQIEQDIIKNLTGGIFVWIGLFREKVWSDGSYSQFRHWANNEPNDGSQQCVAASFVDSGKWSDEDCSQNLSFICYRPIPSNPEGFRASGQDETSITLQWSKVSNNVSFVLQFNGVESIIAAPDGDGPVTHTVSSLTAGTIYTFTLFSVLDDVRSSGVSITAATTPQNTNVFRVLGQDETSITLQWNKVNNDVGFVLWVNGVETHFTPPSGNITYTVSGLTAGSRYTFIVFSEILNIRRSGVTITGATAPLNPQNFRPSGQDETSITLQWSKVNNNVSYVLQLNGAETNITAPNGNGSVTHTVSSLTAGTEYTFTLFSVIDNIRSRGVSITAATAPQNAANLMLLGQTETSITLRWNKVNNGSFVLQFNGAETNITAPDGNGPVNHTVTSLTAGTIYTFTLFSVFDNIRSRGVNITAATTPQNTNVFRVLGQDEASFTLQWNKVNNDVGFVLWVNGVERHFSPPSGNITYTVAGLTAGSRYTFIVFSVILNIRSSGVTITGLTTPLNPFNVRPSGQNETSITLQWSKVNNNVSYVLQLNGTETNITAPDGNGSVTHTVSSLTAGTIYTFTLFSVIENIRSRGVSIYAATAPQNAQNFTLLGQSETTITVGWNKVNNNTGFVLQINGANVYFSPPSGNIIYTQYNLIPGSRYTLTLFSYLNNIFSSGVTITAVTVPSNPQNIRQSTQTETSITLQWTNLSNVRYVLLFNGTETNITAPNGNGSVTHTVSSLTAGTIYTFTLFSVIDNIRSSGVNIYAATTPQNANVFRLLGQDETSITLQWNNTNYYVYYILRVNGAERYIYPWSGNVTYTVSGLTAGSRYWITLFSVIMDIRSSGVNITGLTAPSNPQHFRPSSQDETSITLQWNKVHNNVSYVLRFNGTETFIGAPYGDGPVNYTVSSLTARTNYTFTLFSVIENIRSRGVTITASTGPNFIVGMQMELKSFTTLYKSELEDAVEEFFKKFGILPQISLKVLSVKP